MNHFFRSAYQQDSFEFGVFEGLFYFMSVFVIIKQGCFYCYQESFFFFRRFSCQNFIVMNQQTVINKIVDAVFLGDQFCPERFTCTALPNKGKNLYSSEHVYNIMQYPSHTGRVHRC